MSARFQLVDLHAYFLKRSLSPAPFFTNRWTRLGLTFLLVAFQTTFAFGQETAVEPGATAETASTAPAKGAPPTMFQSLFLESPLGMMMVAMALLYLLVLRPQQRATKKSQLDLAVMLKNLKKNDRVITNAGIHGVVVSNNLDAGTVSIRIDDASSAKMTVNREAIISVVAEEAAKA